MPAARDWRPAESESGSSASRCSYDSSHHEDRGYFHAPTSPRPGIERDDFVGFSAALAVFSPPPRRLPPPRDQSVAQQPCISPVSNTSSAAFFILCFLFFPSVFFFPRAVRTGLLGWWLCERQCDSGGLNGRPEKQADVCYSWWILSALRILGKVGGTVTAAAQGASYLSLLPAYLLGISACLSEPSTSVYLSPALLRRFPGVCRV